MHTPRRLALAATLLTLCAAPAAFPQATNIPAAVARTMTVSTNGVVKAPYGRLVWLTQTNLFARATVTNLTVFSITGVDASEVAVADGGGYFTGTNAETVLQELGASVAAAVGDLTAVQVSGGLLTVSSGTGPVPTVGLTTSAVRNATAIYLPLAGGTMSGVLNLGEFAVTNASTLAFASVGGPSSSDGLAYVNASGDLKWKDNSGSESIFLRTSSGLLPIGQLEQSGASNGQTITWSNGSSEWTPTTISTVATTGSAADLTGDLPAAGFGEVAIRWTDRDFHLEEGTTNSVGWTSYTNTSGSRRFTIDALCSAITTDQAATLRSTFARVPRGFTAFKTTGAIRITWASNDSGGDNEIRSITLSGWSDITSTETILYTWTGTSDVTAAGTPTLISIDRSAFSSTTVPQWMAIDVKFSVEDGDKSGVLLVEVLSE